MTVDGQISHAGRRKRLRERVLRGETRTMSDWEILECLLCYALPRQDVNPLGHRLIDAFGSLDGVLHAPKEAVMAVPGAGAAVAELLGAYADVADGLLEEKKSLTLPGDAALIAQSMDALQVSPPPCAAVLAHARSGGGCQIQAWKSISMGDAARFLIGAASRLNTDALALVWRPGSDERRLTGEQREFLTALREAIEPAGLRIERVLLLGDDGLWTRIDV